MLKNLIRYFCIITIFIGCSGSKNSEGTDTITENSNQSNHSSSSESVSGGLDDKTFTNQQVNFEIKKMFAEINYLKEQLNELDIKSSLYADPFSIYNKEIILNNGSSIFCKILSF